MNAADRLSAITRLRHEIDTVPLPRFKLLKARDLADLVEVDVNTIYVWVNRGVLHPRCGRYDWREAKLWLLTRDLGKISEPEATRAAV